MAIIYKKSTEGDTTVPSTHRPLASHPPTPDGDSQRAVLRELFGAAYGATHPR